MSRVRENLSDRLTLERLRLEARRSRRPLLVLLVGAVVGLVCASYVVSKVGFTPLKSRQTVSFQVATARAVVPSSDEITIKGIPAGRIGDVKLRNGVAVITASFDSKYGPIYQDAKAQLRPNTALQDMVLDIVDRGTPAAGKASQDHPLAPSQTTVSVDVADVLDVFAPQERNHLANLLDQLGNGLQDGGARLRAAFAELGPTVALLDRIAGQVARRRDATRRLVHNAAVLTRELGNRETALRRLVQHGGETLKTLEASGTGLDRTLSELPVTLGALESSFTAVRRTLPSVDAAVTGLRPTARALPDGLAALRGLAEDARPTVSVLHRPVRSLRPLAQQLRPVAGDLDGTFAALRPQVSAIDHVSTALDRCTKSKAVQNFFQWTPSVGKFEDDHGSTIRGDLIFGLDTTTLGKDLGVAPRSCVTVAPKGGTP